MTISMVATKQGILEIMSFLTERLRDDIPVMDYMNGLYGQDIVFDLEFNDHHEIPSRYTKNGKPDAFGREQFNDGCFEAIKQAE
jgi:hypothetical protein